MKFQSVKLGKLCKIQSGGTPRRGVEGYYGGDILWAKIGDIENAKNGYIQNTVETITPSGLKSINNKIFPKNTVFLAMYGSVGKTSIAGLEMTTNQAILGLQPNNQGILHFRYLKYWLDYSKKDLIKKARGVALQNISATIVKEFEIPLPPLEDQKRIVKILDAADALRQKRKQAIGLLDDYLKSVFLDMFGDPVKNPKGWQFGIIGDLVSEVKYGTSAIAGSIGGFPYLRMNNITYSGELDISNLKYINLKEHEKEKYLAKKGDLLFNRTNSKVLVGKTTVFNLDEPMAIAGYLIRVRANEKALTEYISGYLNSKHGKKTLEHMCKNIVGMANINAKELQKIKIFIPPIDLQIQYKNILQKTFILKQAMLTQYTELETQFQALMQKAFKGEI